jgi:hypothetical protein
MTQAIFDPAAPIEAQLADSVSKGFLSASAADQLLAADVWLNANWDRLSKEFPGQAVAVVTDASLDTGFATYVGPTSYEAENKARQFSPGVPYAILEPNPGFATPRVLPVFELLRWMEEAALALRDQIGNGGLFQGKEETEGEKRLREAIEIFEKLRKEGNFPDSKLIETLPPELMGTAAYVGGYISDGAGHENIKHWHIDTGASVSTISKENFERLQKKGATPKQEGEIELKTADGVKKYPKYSGIPMSFVRKDKDGKGEMAKCDVPVVVTSSDLLGLDQLKKTGTKLIIDPAGNSVELVARA